jgi:pimeloyl-ACP methyl ester carboxylesterase
MDSPAVQYVTTSDGYDVAYAVSGSGPPLVALGNTGLEHIQLAWQVPPLRAWLEALTQRFKLVQIDRRGSGLSARGLPADLTMDDFQKDIDAVVGHLGLGRFLLYGALYHLSYVPVQYAVQHPDSVAALILMGTGTSLAAYRAPSLFESVADQDWDLFLRSLALVGRGARTSTEVDRIVALYKQVYDKEDFVTGARVNATTPLTRC